MDRVGIARIKINGQPADLYFNVDVLPTEANGQDNIEYGDMELHNIAYTAGMRNVIELTEEQRESLKEDVYAELGSFCQLLIQWCD